MSTDGGEAAIDARSRSGLTTAKHNLRYLHDPETAPDAPSRRRTRALLRALRSSLIFICWRLVRYAKYVAIGSLVATVGASALGTVASGAGFVLAPTGVAGTIIAGTIWGFGRLAIGRLRIRWGRGHGCGDAEERGEESRSPAKRLETGPEAIPW